MWKGWLDLQRLDGSGYLEFDEDKAKVSLLIKQITSLLTFLTLSMPCIFTHYCKSKHLCLLRCIPCNYQFTLGGFSCCFLMTRLIG